MGNDFTDFNYDGEWAQDNTLGGKAKLFYWKMDDESSLHISRIFKKKDALQRVDVKLSSTQLDLLVGFVEGKGVVPLANSMSKLDDGSEKEGLGRFIFESLNLPLIIAQASSQVAALFVKSDIWTLERKGGMQFKANKVSWKESLRKYHTKGVNIVIH